MQGSLDKNDLEQRLEYYRNWDYHIKIAGPSFRQEALSQLYPLTWEDLEVKLEREPENEYDANAIKVFVNNLFVGYIPAIVAKPLAKQIDADNAQFNSKVIYITEAKGNKKHTLKLALNRR